MIADVLDDAAYSSGGNPKLLSNSVLSVESGLGENVLLGDIWNVVSISHAGRRRRVRVGGRAMSSKCNTAEWVLGVASSPKHGLRRLEGRIVCA